jgi:hypothetical protein
MGIERHSTARNDSWISWATLEDVRTNGGATGSPVTLRILKVVWNPRITFGPGLGMNAVRPAVTARRRHVNLIADHPASRRKAIAQRDNHLDRGASSGISEIASG